MDDNKYIDLVNENIELKKIINEQSIQIAQLQHVKSDVPILFMNKFRALPVLRRSGYTPKKNEEPDWCMID